MHIYIQFLFLSLIGKTEHDLLNINLLHLFTSKFNIYDESLATKTDFQLSHKKKQRKYFKIIKSIHPSLNDGIMFQN